VAIITNEAPLRMHDLFPFAADLALEGIHDLHEKIIDIALLQGLSRQEDRDVNG